MQRVEVEKPAGDWFWGEIAPFLVGLFVWLFFDLWLVVVWFGLLLFVLLVGLVGFSFVSLIVWLLFCW